MANIVQNNIAKRDSVYSTERPNDFDFIADPKYAKLSAMYSPRYALWDNIAGANRLLNLVDGNYASCASSFTVSDNNLIPVGNQIITAPKFNFNPTAWSYFVVTKPASAVNIKHLVYTQEQQSGVHAVRIAITGAGVNLLVYANSNRGGGQPIRLRHDSNFSARPDPSILFVTFSVEDGLKIFDNGQLVATAPDDKEPLDFGYFGHQLRCFGEGGHTDCQYGEFGVFAEDISLVPGLVDDLYQNLLALRA